MDWERHLDRSSTWTSSSTIPGIGALTGKGIKKLGLFVLKPFDFIIYHRRLAQYEGIMKKGPLSSSKPDAQDRKSVCVDLLELSRPIYGLSVRKRAFCLIMGMIGSFDSIEELASSVVDLDRCMEPYQHIADVSDCLGVASTSSSSGTENDTTELITFRAAGYEAYTEQCRLRNNSGAVLLSPFLAYLSLLAALGDPWVSRVLAALNVIDFISDFNLHPSSSPEVEVRRLLLHILTEKLDPLYDSAYASLSRLLNALPPPSDLHYDETLSDPPYDGVFRPPLDPLETVRDVIIEIGPRESRVSLSVANGVTAGDMVTGPATELSNPHRDSFDTTSAVLPEVRSVVELANLQKTLDLLAPRQYLSLGPRSRCMPGTRRATLAMIMDWIARGDTSVLWLHGLAGSGKSSVMGSLSDELSANNCRAAFICFNRFENSDPSVFVRILAYEMAKLDNRLGEAIAESIRRSSTTVQHAHLAKQFSVLILDPLSSKLCEGMKDEGPIAVMVDGVDECAVGYMREQLLTLLADGFRGHPYVRLVISSRPEEDLRHAFGQQNHLHICQVPLDINSPETTEDIGYFIAQRLSAMGDDLQEYCRTSDAISKLSDRASGLFIWAAAVLNSVQQFPKMKLPAILETDVPTNVLKPLDEVYKAALNSANGAIDDEDIKSVMCVALGVIIISSLTSPYHINVAVFKKIMQDRKFLYADELLCKMGALVAPDDKGTLRLLHKSFSDFLTDESRCGDSWYIDIQHHTRDMLSTCLFQLSSFFRDPVSLSRDTPPEVLFACSSWIKCTAILDDLTLLPSQALEMLAELFGIYFLRWLIISSHQVNPGPSLVDSFESLRDASDKVRPDLTDAIQDLLFVVDINSEETALSRVCFKWLCRQPLSSRFRQIYLPAYVEMADGSPKFSDIIAAIEQNYIPPVGVKDPHEVEILGVPFMTRGKEQEGWEFPHYLVQPSEESSDENASVLEAIDDWRMK